MRKTPNRPEFAPEAEDRPRKRATLLGVAAVVGALILAAGALAYLSTEGEGVAEASVVKMEAPTITGATASTGGTVTLNWKLITAPGPGTVVYYVSRNEDEASGNCPGEENPTTTATTCTDSSLAPGTYEYTVSAVYRHWTSISAVATVEVTVGPIAKFAIKGTPTTVGAGEGINLTITAQDSSGGTVTTYTGSHSFKFAGASESPAGNKPSVVNSSGSAILFGNATALTFTNGVATAASSKNGYLRVYKSGESSITATEGSTTTTTPLVVNVNPLATSRFGVAAANATPSAAAADNLTVTAQDAYGNTTPTYVGTKSLIFSGASESTSGAKPTVTNASGTAVAFGTATTITFASGVSTVSGSNNGAMTIYKSGAATIKATEGSLTTTTGATVTVAPLAAVGLTIAPASTTTTVNTADNLVISARDTYGNVATSYAGSKSITFAGAELSPSGAASTVTNASGTATNFGTATALTFTAGVNTIASGKNGVAKFFKAGTANITATDGTYTTPSVAVTVSPGTATKFSLAVATTTPAAGADDNLTITAQDAYSNTATAYTGAKSLTFAGPAESPSGVKPTVSNSSGTDVAIGTATAINFTAGVSIASGGANGALAIYKSGATTIKATEGTITNTAVAVTVSPLAATSLSLGASTVTPVAGASDNLTITAKDTYGNTATSYSGSKSLTFSGAEASPSGTAATVTNSSGTATNFGTATALTFTNGANTISGSNNGVLKLNKAGTANVVATDGTFTSPALTFTVTPGTAARVAFTSTTVSAGTIASPCLFTCTATTLGNSGTFKSNLAITDSLGNVVSNIGASKTATITVSGSPTGTIAGSPVSFPETGSAISSTQFTYTAPSSGSYTNTITAASTGYTSATATVSK